ncbi:MAG TPA: alkaline phosphatase family protein, partial [Candidatus Baltobacteraceae bacterium]|nr:alkaline phosphatase family protein [Candidatus Baltobacteraceae bacterium]
GGKMNGFDLEAGGGGTGPAGTYPYLYVDPKQIAPYWTLAKRYVLADHFFSTQGSDSFTAHQDVIAGGTQIDPSQSLIDLPSPGGRPWGCDAPKGTVTSLITLDNRYLFDRGPFPCLAYPTLAALLNRKHVSWKYYTPSFSQPGGQIWNAFDAIKAIRYSQQWKTNVSRPDTNVFVDIGRGRLPAVSWVIPEPHYSDHPHAPVDDGPSWVASIVNAIGSSSYWNSTVIVIVWDEWGGLYDHVPPPQMGFGGLGMRIPAIVVSPYARRGYVSHTQYEFGSILKFVENVWGLGRLGTTDVRANSIGDTLDFKQPPQKFVPVAALHSKEFFLRGAR